MNQTQIDDRIIFICRYQGHKIVNLHTHAKYSSIRIGKCFHCGMVVRCYGGGMIMAKCGSKATVHIIEAGICHRLSVME